MTTPASVRLIVAAVRDGGGPALVEDLGDAEIEHLDRAVRPDLDVGRLQVAMHDALLMGGFERVGNLAGDAESVLDRQRASVEALGERRSTDQLEHQRRASSRVHHPVDRRDVGVVQRGHDAGFTLEAGEAGAIAGEPLGKHLSAVHGPAGTRPARRRASPRRRL